MLADDPPVPYLPIEPRAATDDELAYVHERGYIDLIRSTAGQTVPMDGDTVAGPKTWETALLAAGGFLESVDRVMDGTVRNALALVRPPGHHAEASRAMGFCFFNNAAIAAEHLVRKRGLKRILVVDLGPPPRQRHASRPSTTAPTSSTSRPTRSPSSRAPGPVRFFGRGEGFGYNLNVPLLAGKGDADFLHIFEKVLAPVAAEYRPEFILASIGFDIAAGRSPRSDGGDIRRIRAPDRVPHGHGRTDRPAGGWPCVLEGGYDLRGHAGRRPAGAAGARRG